MKFSVNWLKQWVELELGAQQIAERLTASGLEVDAVEPVASDFSDVLIAQIVSAEPHPDADKLQVCRVRTEAGDSEGSLQIVCGAPNARPGLIAPLAVVGAQLGPDMKIRRAKLRGVDSEGMLCSARELGLSEDHSGLLELPADAPIGSDFRGWLELDDHSIEIDLTPNRADCLSIRGIARDVSASCAAVFRDQPVQPVAATSETGFPIRLHDPAGCPRYAGRVIEGIDPAARSPLWLREALRRCGVRSISPAVDVTNFVLLERGQPMHAFDLDRLHGEIIVRRGQPGEKLVLLDDSEVELDGEVLAICDARGPLALAGIMGGNDSAVGEGTTRLLLESAWFSPAVIMGRARRFGLHTDASHRFERGVDAQGQVEAIERATELLLEICGGTAGPVLLAESPDHLPVQSQVSLRHARLEQVIGCPFDRAVVDTILERLGMQPQSTEAGWVTTPPSSRVDIAIEEDLIEEVARIHGYDGIPAAQPSGPVEVGSMAELRVSQLEQHHLLTSEGFQEAICYSFVDRRLVEALGQGDQALPLANPLSSDMDVMRTSLLPGLLAALDHNRRRQHSRIRLFESGTAFLQGPDGLDEEARLAGVMAGSASPEQWGLATREVDFFDIKGVVERLCGLRGGDVPVFSASSKAFLHPGMSSDIELSGQALGWCGAVHPAVLKQFDIEGEVFAFELGQSLLQSRELQVAKNTSRFPSIRRDLAIWVPEQVRWSEVRHCVVDAAGELLQNAVVFDVYHDENLKKGYKSLAIGLILQNVSSTLTDDDVDPVVQRIVSRLQHEMRAQMRG